MALISSKLMCLEPILKLNCKILMRFLAATVVRTIPRCALESSPIHTNGRIKPDFVPASLFSTDSKRPKKTKQGDKSISKHMNHPFEKKKGEPYTDKHDKLILERVKKMGYDNPETWKSLAIDFNMKWSQNIKARCNVLLRRESGERQTPKSFTKEEDALIIQKVEKMGYDNIQTWKTLAIDLGRDPTYYFVIRGRYDLIINRDTKETKRYTEEDDNFILIYVEKNGESKTTWQELATKFGVDEPSSIKSHYHQLLENFVKGKYTKEDDEIILNYVKIHGNSFPTFKKLRAKLNRANASDIKRRFEYLQTKPSKRPGPWEIEEDTMLIKHFFKVNGRFNQSIQSVNQQQIKIDFG